MARIKYNERGEEIPDSSRPAVPLGFKKPESLADQVRRLIRSEALRAGAHKAGVESFDEADDFDVGDDYDPRSPFEEVFDPVDAPEVTATIKARSQPEKPAEPRKGGNPSPKKKSPKPKAEETDGEDEGEDPS